MEAAYIRYNHHVKKFHSARIAYFPLRHGFAILCTVTVLFLGVTGCARFTQQKEPTNSQPIPLTPVIWYSPSVTAAEVTYDNACGEKTPVALAGALMSTVPQKLTNVFDGVVAQRQVEEPLASEGVIEVGIGHRRIDMVIPKQAPGIYPVTATVGMEMVFLARDGTLLFSKKLEGTGRGTAAVGDQSCQIEGLEPVVQEAITAVADQLAKQMAQSSQIREYAARRATWPSMADRSQTEVMPPVAGTVAVPPTTGLSTLEPPQIAPRRETAQQPAQLSFRAIIRDENRDHLLDPNEALTIEVEVKNEGIAQAQDVLVLVQGKAKLEGLFPSDVAIGTLQPGESKRISITKRATASEEILQGELILNLRAATPLTFLPPPKTFTLGDKPKHLNGLAGPDVDQLPKSFVAFHQPKAVIIAIGVGTFRDERIPDVKYAGYDAQVMAEYLRTISNIPGERVRVLLSRKALERDFEEVFEQWLPKRVDRETVVYVFFSGRAVVDAGTGAISLVPYDGTLTEPKQLYPLRRLQEALYRLPLRRAILMFDVSMDPSPGGDLAAIPTPAWESDGSEARKDVEMWMVGNQKLQDAYTYDQGKHGLFTYHLLRGLQGVADLDRNGTIIAGELCTYARGQVARVTRDQFGSRQDPICLPQVGRGGKARIHPVAKGDNPKPVAMPKESEPPAGPSTPPQNPIQQVGP